MKSPLLVDGRFGMREPPQGSWSSIQTRKSCICLCETVNLSPDVLTVRAILGGKKYPSKNQEGADGRRGGRKSPQYIALSELICANATAERLATGWTTASCPCLAVVVLYVPDRQYRRDAFNIGTAEANALTNAGIWADDTLAHEVIKKIVIDPTGPLRVTITVFKLFEPQHLRSLEPNPAKSKTSHAKSKASDGMIKGLSRVTLGVSRPKLPKY